MVPTGPPANRSLTTRKALPFTDEEHTRALADLSADLIEGFDRASTVPRYAGIEFGL